MTQSRRRLHGIKAGHFKGWSRLILLVITMLAALSLAAILLGCGDQVLLNSKSLFQVGSPANYHTQQK